MDNSTDNEIYNELEGDLEEVEESAEKLANTANALQKQSQGTFAGKGFTATSSGRSMEYLRSR